MRSFCERRNVGEVVLGALTRQRDFGRAGFAGAERHDAILRGAQPGVERFFQILAADLHKMAAFLLTRLPALALIGAFEEIRRRAGVKPRDVVRRVWDGRANPEGNRRERW